MARLLIYSYQGATFLLLVWLSLTFIYLISRLVFTILSHLGILRPETGLWPREYKRLRIGNKWLRRLLFLVAMAVYTAIILLAGRAAFAATGETTTLGASPSAFASDGPTTATPTPALNDTYGAYVNATNAYARALNVYVAAANHNPNTGPSSGPTATSTATPIPDPWSDPAFHEAMTTLWAAPLTILAIVFAVAGIAGWQGYKDLREQLATKLSEDIRGIVHLAIGVAHGNAAWNSYVLAINTVNLKEEYILSHLPLSDRTFIAQMTFAKATAELALRYLADFHPKSKVTFFDVSQEFYLRQIEQRYAYFVAICYDNSSPAEWQKALTYSELANRALTNPERFQHEPLEDKYDEEAITWKSTFFYVRILYAAKLASETTPTSDPSNLPLLRENNQLLGLVQNNKEAKRELDRAFEEYKALTATPDAKARYHGVIKLFRPQLGDPEPDNIKL